MIFKKDYLFIIQARMGSKRFPGKVLHPIYKSKSTLDILLERFEDEKTNLLIATTNKPEDDQIEEYCKKNNLFLEVLKIMLFQDSLRQQKKMDFLK